MSVQHIISNLFEDTFDDYSQYSIKFKEKYWKKYQVMLDNNPDIDSDYYMTYISKEDEGYSVYHAFSLVYKGNNAGAYVNMKINTIDDFKDIEVMDFKGNILLTIK